MWTLRAATVVLLTVGLSLAGCAAGVTPAPDLGGIYNRAAQAGDAARNPVIARDHLRKSLARAQRFHAALDRPATPPAGLGLHLFAGDANPTPARLAVEPVSGKVSVREHGPGDGTVLRTSAVLDERVGSAWTRGLASPITWSSITFPLLGSSGADPGPRLHRQPPLPPARLAAAIRAGPGGPYRAVRRP
jgi:hypothetical protein